MSVIASANSLNAKLIVGLCLLMLAFGLGTPLWLAVLPWVAYHYARWRRLNNEFTQLRHARAFSPYSEFAESFQAAGSRLRLGLALGAIPWSILALLLVLGLLRAALTAA
ncbi:MAG: hypothetical protein RIC55_15115 [Pirellulaceae bacterium]